MRDKIKNLILLFHDLLESGLISNKEDNLN